VTPTKPAAVTCRLLSGLHSPFVHENHGRIQRKQKMMLNWHA